MKDILILIVEALALGRINRGKEHVVVVSKLDDIHGMLSEFLKDQANRERDDEAYRQVTNERLTTLEGRHGLIG